MIQIRSRAQVGNSGPNINLPDSGLYSTEGARKVIAQLKSRLFVSKLILGHNELGDNGCVELFDYLSSPEGRKYRITGISLNSNSIGDVGLKSIARYLENNQNLQGLSLQNNAFAGDSETTKIFTDGLNSSRLGALHLTANVMSDSFISEFLPCLDAKYLQELHLSAMGITQRSCPHIISYLMSPRCRPLKILKLNGNSLGSDCVREIINTVEKSNFTIQRLELHSNGFEALQNSDSLSATTKSLAPAISRNEYLLKETRKGALELLQCARATLLKPALSSKQEAPLHESAFRFSRLPIELQLQILNHVVPTLSTAQRLRIFEYASERSTLPPLLPRLEVRTVRGSTDNAREREREKWFITVLCHYYDCDKPPHQL